MFCWARKYCKNEIKRKLRRKLFSIKSEQELSAGDVLMFNQIQIGKV